VRQGSVDNLASVVACAVAEDVVDEVIAGEPDVSLATELRTHPDSEDDVHITVADGVIDVGHDEAMMRVTGQHDLGNR
jgi:hypothetical protein